MCSRLGPRIIGAGLHRTSFLSASRWQSERAQAGLQQAMPARDSVTGEVAVLPLNHSCMSRGCEHSTQIEPDAGYEEGVYRRVWTYKTDTGGNLLAGRFYVQATRLCYR